MRDVATKLNTETAIVSARSKGPDNPVYSRIGGGPNSLSRRTARRPESRFAQQGAIEREEKVRLELERRAEIDRQRAAGVAGNAAEAKAAGVKLAKDVLEEFMRLFAAIAKAVQPYPTWHVEKRDGRDVRVNGQPRL